MTSYRDIQIHTLEYKEPKSNAQTGGKTINVSTVPGSNDYNHRLRFQMSPDCNSGLQTAQYGLSSPMQGQPEDRRRSLELSLDDELLGFLTALDQKNVDMGTMNSEAYFKKSMDRSTIENMYNPIVRQPSNAEYRPMVRTKVKIGEKVNTNVWIAQESGDKSSLQYVRGSHTDITKGCKCMVLVETAGIWVAAKQFGMSLVVTDIMVWPVQREFFYFGPNIKGREVPSESTQLMDYE